MTDARGGEALFRVLGLFDQVKTSGNGWKVHCPGPVHQRGDRHESLQIAEGYDGRVILHCMAGCATEDVVSALGLSMGDLFEKPRNGLRRYRFGVQVNGDNVVHLRTEKPDGSKT